MTMLTPPRHDIGSIISKILSGKALETYASISFCLMSQSTTMIISVRRLLLDASARAITYM